MYLQIKLDTGLLPQRSRQTLRCGHFNNPRKTGFNHHWNKTTVPSHNETFFISKEFVCERLPDVCSLHVNLPLGSWGELCVGILWHEGQKQATPSVWWRERVLLSGVGGYYGWGRVWGGGLGPQQLCILLWVCSQGSGCICTSSPSSTLHTCPVPPFLYPKWLLSQQMTSLFSKLTVTQGPGQSQQGTGCLFYPARLPVFGQEAQDQVLFLAQ